ncbi:MAG: Fur family transcriptional regulator [Acidimicrobiales bacterium]
MRTPAELTQLFRAHGRKVTPQRQCIFRALHVESRQPAADGHPADGHPADGHPTAERVYEVVHAELETISRKTVYQTLHELAEMGEVVALDVGTGAVRYDPNVEHAHHHLVCRACGRIRDLFVDLPEVELPASLAQGYQVEGREVVFRGLCGGCRALPPPAADRAPLEPAGAA